MKRRQLTFLTRSGCGLCAEALPRVTQSARWLRVGVDVVDIATDSTLEAEYHIRIPVVLNRRGRVVAEGRISQLDALKAVVSAGF